MMFSRVGMAVTTVLNNAQLLRHTPNEFRGRVFSTMESMRWSVMIVSMAAAGIASQYVESAYHRTGGRSLRFRDRPGVGMDGLERPPP